MVGGGGPPSANPFSPTPHTHNARNVSEILPGRLYISDLAFAENPSLLSSYRITHILSTLPDNIFCPPPTLLPVQPTRLQIRVDDLPFAELAAHLPRTTAWIRDALSGSPDARVLVHCGEGISRSVSVVAAYLMAQYNWTPMEAVSYVKSKRRVAEPNFGFIQQLHEYARDGLGRTNVGNPVHPSSAPGYGS
jgi:atypical dual specificity phosphatase